MLEPHIRRRLRSAFIVVALLMPTFCAFPVLAVLAPVPLRWVIVGVWVVIAALLGLLVRRIQVLLAATGGEGATEQSSNR